MEQRRGQTKPSYVRSSVDIPQDMCGRLIGKRGQTIKYLREVYGVRIEVKEEGNATGTARVVVSGTEPGPVEEAKKMVLWIVNIDDDDCSSAPEGWFHVDIPAKDVKCVVGKDGETIKCLEDMCDTKLLLLQDPSKNRCRVLYRAADAARAEEAKRALLSATYGGIVKTDLAKASEEVLTKVERTGVSIKLRHRDDKWGAMVLILGDNQRTVEVARTKLLEQLHHWHTPTNMGRKKQSVLDQKREKKQNDALARKCRGLRKGDTIPFKDD